MRELREGDSGPEVRRLQQCLQAAGFDPGELNGDFGFMTLGALQAFQNSQGIPPSGVADAETLAALGLLDDEEPAEPPDSDGDSIIARVYADTIAPLFPGAPLSNIENNLPYVLSALDEFGLGDRAMILMALATIRAETGSFEPISERVSSFNTSPGGEPFDKYDNRRDLGNQGPPDGASFKGRGFIQLTGRDNYRRFGRMIGLGDDLEDDPELANEPESAARLLAAFLKAQASRIRNALAAGDWREARRAVNGGTHGLEQFRQAYELGEQLIDKV